MTISIHRQIAHVLRSLNGQSTQRIVATAAGARRPTDAEGLCVDGATELRMYSALAGTPVDVPVDQPEVSVVAPEVPVEVPVEMLPVALAGDVRALGGGSEMANADDSR